VHKAGQSGTADLSSVAEFNNRLFINDNYPMTPLLVRSSGGAIDETFDSIITIKKFLVHKMAVATL
jgi:hypothetical protein